MFSSFLEYWRMDKVQKPSNSDRSSSYVGQLLYNSKYYHYYIHSSVVNSVGFVSH
jgi:hypothetical protein